MVRRQRQRQFGLSRTPEKDSRIKSKGAAWKQLHLLCSVVADRRGPIFSTHPEKGMCDCELPRHCSSLHSVLWTCLSSSACRQLSQT